MKTLLMITEMSKEPFEVSFHSSQQYNKIYNKLMSEKPSDNTALEIKHHEDQLIVNSKDVYALYFDNKYLQQEKEDQRSFILSLTFDGQEAEYSIPVIGEKRSKNEYRILKLLFNRAPTNRIISIMQDKSKTALFRHVGIIKELKLRENEQN